jgi:hypothetical protein
VCRGSRNPIWKKIPEVATAAKEDIRMKIEIALSALVIPFSIRFDCGKITTTRVEAFFLSRLETSCRKRINN